MLGLTRCVSLGLSVPIFEMGEKPELSGSLAIQKAWGSGRIGRGEGAARTPPSLRGGSAHERRGRRGPAAGRGGSARARARAGGGTERASVRLRRRQLLWDPPIRPASRRPVRGSPRLQPSPPRAGEWPGAGAELDRAFGPRKGRGPGRGAVTHTRAEGGAHARTRDPEARRGRAGRCVRLRSGRV